MTTAFKLYNMPLFRTALPNPLFSMKAYLYKNLILARDFASLRKRLLTEYSELDIMNSVAGAGLSYKEAVIYLLVRKYKPRVMIETGVANGATSYCILRAMRDNKRGSLVSIDYPMYKPAPNDPFHLPKNKKPGWLVPRELRGRWKLILGKSSTALPKFNEKVDMFFHDSEHSYKNMMFEYNWALKHTAVGGIILSDDINWNTAFRDFLNANKQTLKPLKFPVYGCAKVVEKSKSRHIRIIPKRRGWCLSPI